MCVTAECTLIRLPGTCCTPVSQSISFLQVHLFAFEASSLQLCNVRRRVPAWRQLLASPDFQLIAAVNAVIFTTNNGGRSVLMPLLAKEHLAMKTSTLGAHSALTRTTGLV
jgi:hypothetical protein